MNLFLLHADPIKAALVHCDKHCVKMILETCQLLYTAWHLNQPGCVEISSILPNDPCPHKPYKCTHKNHPSAKWVRADKAHYNWAIKLGFALCFEYTRRYGKVHKCQSHLDRLATLGFPKASNLPEDPPLRKRALTGLPLGCKYFDCAINDELFDDCAVYNDQGRLNGIQTYRNYYCIKGNNNWVLNWNKGRDTKPKWYKRNILK